MHVEARPRWGNQSLIHLERRRGYQTCELCSTPFGVGGIVRHSRLAPAISVGGTCLVTILRTRFDAETIRSRVSATTKALNSHYRKRIDSGDWLTWLERNATSELVPILADLRHLNMTASEDQLLTLIRFHDEHRLYAISAILPDWRSLVRSSGGAARFRPRMTISQVRELLVGLPPDQYAEVVMVRPFLAVHRRASLAAIRVARTLPSDAYIG
jgi:hypothetical protein